jgi:PhoH-like ATPase
MPVILVTKNILMRIKAQMMRIKAEDFTAKQAPVSDKQYTGRCEAYVFEKSSKA